MMTRCAHRLKGDAGKSRLVVKDIAYEKVSGLCCSTHAHWALARIRGCVLQTAVVSPAFLHAGLPEPAFVEPPPGMWNRQTPCGL